MKFDDYHRSVGPEKVSAHSRAEDEDSDSPPITVRFHVETMRGDHIAWLANRMAPYEDATDLEVAAAWREIKIRDEMTADWAITLSDPLWPERRARFLDGRNPLPEDEAEARAILAAETISETGGCV